MSERSERRVPEPVVPETPVAEEAPESTVSDEAPPPVVEVEPYIGFDEFVDLAHVSQPAQAALRRWMRDRAKKDRQYDPNGHYPVATWRQYLAGLFAHT